MTSVVKNIYVTEWKKDDFGTRLMSLYLMCFINTKQFTKYLQGIQENIVK